MRSRAARDVQRGVARACLYVAPMRLQVLGLCGSAPRTMLLQVPPRPARSAVPLSLWRGLTLRLKGDMCVGTCQSFVSFAQVIAMVLDGRTPYADMVRAVCRQVDKAEMCLQFEFSGRRCGCQFEFFCGLRWAASVLPGAPRSLS
jgi:hypothetical protein